MSKDLSAIFGAHAAGATYEDLTPGAIRAAKHSTLDTLGVILGASGLVDSAAAVAELAREWGGSEESTVLGFGGKLPALSAAFVNGSMGHGLDFDDHLPEGHHPSVTVLPALLALAEREGHVTGRDFITALAVGQDIFARLRKNVDWKQDWFMTPVIGSIASAAACARLLGLDAEQCTHAIGVGSAQSAMTMQTAYGTGGDLRGMYAGFAAKAAVLSAQLAQRGIKATTESLEGGAAFLPVYFGEWDRDAMIEGLGKDFQGSTILYKMWPSCGVTHPYIDTALTLLGGTGRTDEIERIEVFGGEFAKRLSEPAELRQRPPTSNDAKFSLPYTVALALLNGGISVGDFSSEHRSDPAVHEVARKVEFVDDPTLEWGATLPAGAVRITMRDGEVLHAEASHDSTPGASLNPLSWDQLVLKFDDCLAHSVRPPQGDGSARAVRFVAELEQQSDVAALVELLA